MANDLLIPNVASDAVAVFDDNFNQLFIEGRPTRVNVTEESRLFDHTIETGQVITDYAIILPVEIEIQIIVMAESYRDVYQEIRNLYLNKPTLVVQTRTTTYDNMVLAAMPHEERPDMYDALPLRLRFREAQIVDGVPNFVPADPTQANTEALGTQTEYPVNAVSGVTPTSAQDFYSSVQAASNPQGVTINGVATPNGVANFQMTAPPAAQIPVTGAQTLTSQQTIVRGFN